MIASPQILEAEAESTLEAIPSKPDRSIERKPNDVAVSNTSDETLYLAGRPTLKGFLRFVRTHAVNPPSRGTLMEDWQAARDHIRLLEREEAGCADNPIITPIKVESKYKPLLIEFLKDPLVQNSFNTVPTEVAFVELDRLVVYQKHIDLTFVRQLKQKLGAAPSEEAIFRACLSYDHPRPPAKWCRVRGDRFVFVSPSNDIRFLGHMSLKPRHIKDYPHPGALVGVVGLAVGFGSNFLNAFYAENRLILNNGSHRAYALRDMGFTHVPCIVQHVSSRDQLDVVAASAVADDPDCFLKGPRPAMLKDYFNPKLRKIMPVHRRLKQITVKFEVEDAYVPGF